MPERAPNASPAHVLLGQQRDLHRELMLQTYDSVVPPQSAIYCSAPITSGRRYLEWITRQDGPRRVIDDLSDSDRALHRQHVIEPNRAHANEVANELRHRTSKPVIDPTAVGPIPGWRQTDWIAFWEEVIARHCTQVVLIDGWEYSYGCTHEFWFAHSRGIPTLDESGRLLTPSQGAQRIRAAVADLRRAGADPTKLERVLELLRGLAP